jgi:glyoxylase-like metal-dependent hydrolase (beta-lactamase superfamily II)
VAALAVALVARAQPPGEIERGTLPPAWPHGAPGCADRTPFFVHPYNPDVLILRQSGCTNFEKPFLYLVFGAAKALLVDTGASGADGSAAVKTILAARRAPTPLVVIHSHGHGDHVAGDAQLEAMAGVTVVKATVAALQSFFGIKSWPDEIASYDLGGRMIDVIPIPGHQVASIAIYDRRTGLLLTGDTLYPGRLYVRDGAAFTASIRRLVAFTRGRPVTHVLGAHVENARTPYVDYPEGTTHQPDEHPVELGRAHLLELLDGLEAMNGRLERRAFRDFTIWPLPQP